MRFIAGYLKNYSPPLGFIGIGLQVFNLYDNGDNTWIGNKNKPGELVLASTYGNIKLMETLAAINEMHNLFQDEAVIGNIMLFN